VSGRTCWAIAVASCYNSTADCKAPKKLLIPLGPYPFPLHPLGPLHAARSNGWVPLLTAISYGQAFTAADIWTSYNNWWRPAHEINGTRALILLPGDLLVNKYPAPGYPLADLVATHLLRPAKNIKSKIWEAKSQNYPIYCIRLHQTRLQPFIRSMLSTGQQKDS